MTAENTPASVPVSVPQTTATVVARQADAIERALIKGDLSGLNTEQRLEYLRQVCESMGLNPLTRPFDFIEAKEGSRTRVTLYARREAAEQLSRIHGVTVEIVGREVVDTVVVVQARATMTTATGARRANEDVGAVEMPKSAGDRANAIMKAITKARRRAVLGLVGLGMLDESEIETSRSAQAMPEPQSIAASPTPVAPALPAPVAPAPGSTAQPGQLAEIVKLKSEANLNGPAWAEFLAPWQGRKPSSMSSQECEAVLVALRHRISADHLEAGLTGPDGLAVGPGPSVNGRSGTQPTSFPRA